MPNFPLTYRPDEHEAFLDALADWFRSDAIGWLLDRVALPAVLGRPETLRDPSATFHDIATALGELDDWRAPGTAWDTRGRDERHVAELTASNGNGHAGDSEIRERATELGMRSSRQAGAGAHRVVVAMGGARMAPLRRTQWLADQMATGRITADHFVALGCDRRLHESEQGLGYAAPDATTELDLLEGALRATGMALGSRSPDVHLMAAPTTRADGDRADTAESLEFMAGELGLERGDSLVLSTSPIYSAYTQLVGVRVLGLRGHSVETVAHPLTRSVPASPVGPLYVQEVRSAVQAALDLADVVVR